MISISKQKIIDYIFLRNYVYFVANERQVHQIPNKILRRRDLIQSNKCKCCQKPAKWQVVWVSNKNDWFNNEWNFTLKQSRGCKQVEEEMRQNPVLKLIVDCSLSSRVDRSMARNCALHLVFVHDTTNIRPWIVVHKYSSKMQL